MKEAQHRTPPFHHILERSSPQAGGSYLEVDVDVADAQSREVIDRATRGVPGQEVSALPHQRADGRFHEAALHMQPLLVFVAYRSA